MGHLDVNRCWLVSCRFPREDSLTSVSDWLTYSQAATLAEALKAAGMIVAVRESKQKREHTRRLLASAARRAP